jgi:arylsulfatase A-like enzyme
VPEELRPTLARQMEVYSGFLEHTDHHVGRLLDALEELDILEDTLIYYVVGDNGASGEGGINGSFNEGFVFNGEGHLETPEFLAYHMDELGTPAAYNHYAVGWAHACDTPYQWTKQVASHWGGTRCGAVVHWPNGIRAKDEVRSQFCHVVDVAPTILEAAGLPCRLASTACSKCRCTAPAWPTPSTKLRRQSAAIRSISRSSSTAASTTRAGPP